MAEFGLESLSFAQVSRAAALMDEELEAWRTRQRGAFTYLFLPLPVLGARYEKVRLDGPYRQGGARRRHPVGNRRPGGLRSDPWKGQGQQALEARIDEDGKRNVLGLSVALSEAEVHWRGFLDSLVARGLRGVRFITSDDHAGLPNQRLGRPQGRLPRRGPSAIC